MQSADACQCAHIDGGSRSTLAAGLTHAWWCPYFAGVAKSFIKILLLQHKTLGVNTDTDASEACLSAALLYPRPVETKSGVRQWAEDNALLIGLTVAYRWRVLSTTVAYR